ncbi:MAG: ribbon-helix-helix domain-containing protein [Candidatus Micrarchaeia archaeon]|jgi:Arc/MetJ-type ribon-helix-helix transcriptional regulator
MKKEIVGKAGEGKRKYTTITIPTPLFEKIKRVIENTGFSSVSDYATYILRETIAKIEEEKLGKGKADDELTKKLRALGYI